MKIKNLIGLTLLCFLNASCMEITTTDEHLALAPHFFELLPAEIFPHIIHNLDIKATRDVKLTCQLLNENIKYHQISTDKIKSENYDLCTAGLCRFIRTGQEKNLEKLFQNNTRRRIQVLRCLSSTLKNDTIITYTLIEQLCNNLHNTITDCMWGQILSNDITLSIALCNRASLNKLDTFGETSIAKATFSNSLKTLTLLLNNGTDPNLQDKDGFTPLKGAVMQNNQVTAKLLLKNNANPNAQDKDGFTPLRWAAIGNYQAMAKLLLKNGADPKIQDDNGLTPIEYAMSKKHVEMVTLLLSKDANQNAQNEYGFTPLTYATLTNNLEMATLLLKNGANPNTQDEYEFTPLIYAFVTKNIEMVTLLLDNGANPNL